MYQDVRCANKRPGLPAKRDTVVLADAPDLLAGLSAIVPAALVQKSFMKEWHAQDQTDLKAQTLKRPQP